ncbi:TRAF3-interacting protein 1 [Odontomachus brunneus]|uniref:TRAF3-interacting protein 1 n=1 Tax=Odontomachus brunneus TaxID=486640 RepID=UPI0013F20BAB|nr:TRAF3-interacting protein 1 [Odontomachus brunneus]
MTDEVRPEVIKKTQDVLGKYFKKPPLTEKLLRKPPFRFLHDIISTIIAQTGFLEGLFTEEELNSDNIKDKEAKLAFLTKLIDVVKLISAANLTVRASKIISGQEPTKTNELLQAIGKALDKKVSSTEAIEHYKKSLEKKAKTGSKLRSTTKEESQKKHAARQSSQTRKSSEKDKISAEQRKKSSSSTGKVASGGAKRINDKTDEKVSRETKESNSKNVDAIDIPVAEPVERKVSASAQRRKSSSSAKSKQNVTASVVAAESTEEQTLHRSSSSRIRHSAQASGSREKVGNLPAESLHEEEDKSPTNNHINENKENGISEEDKVSQQSAEKNDQSTSELVGSQVETTETTVLQQLNTRPKTSLRPPSARPISARPAAPRMRAKAELIVNEEIQTPLGNISVIVESSDLKDDDDDAEDMVVMETKGSNGDFLENGDYKIDNQLMQEHGHLVAQILETQRELVNTDNVDVIPKKVDIAWESGSKRDREAAAREVDKLRGTIQTLTRTTNPLGKLLDYVQEDVEMMEKELSDWKSQYRQLSDELEREQKETEEMIEPMKETLKEIDSNMKTQLDKICQVKSQIIKNDQKIQRLLNGHL